MAYGNKPNTYEKKFKLTQCIKWIPKEPLIKKTCVEVHESTISQQYINNNKLQETLTPGVA